MLYLCICTMCVRARFLTLFKDRADLLLHHIGDGKWMQITWRRLKTYNRHSWLSNEAEADNHDREKRTMRREQKLLKGTSCHSEDGNVWQQTGSHALTFSSIILFVIVVPLTHHSLCQLLQIIHDHPHRYPSVSTIVFFSSLQTSIVFAAYFSSVGIQRRTIKKQNTYTYLPQI